MKRISFLDSWTGERFRPIARTPVLDKMEVNLPDDFIVDTPRRWWGRVIPRLKKHYLK